MAPAYNNTDFAAIVHEYTDYVFNLAYRILGHKDDAKDAVQETFLKLYKSLHQYDSSRQIKSWICTIALNASRDIYRARKRHSQTKNIDDYDIPDKKNTEQWAGQKLDAEKLLLFLPLEYRTVMILFYMEEKSLKEIAGMLGIPVVLVKVRLFRARKMIIKTIRERSNER